MSVRPHHYSHISVALPLLAEHSNLPAVLQRLRQQTWRDFTLYCCVNNDEGGQGYDDNQASLALLRSVTDLPIVLIDRSSKGMGWTGKKRGVGWARKSIFDLISDTCPDDEIIVSLDADTDFDAGYLEAVAATFRSDATCHALCMPYYHQLTGDETIDRAMLRYECYMRHYLIGLLRIHNPYAFTALGSAMSFPLWAYRRAGGISPLPAGEDFYLMQKFVKTGSILLLPSPTNEAGSTGSSADAGGGLPMMVRPQARRSWRVPFGTGPAIARGAAEMSSLYPFYTDEAFGAVRASYDAFSALFDHDVETPMSAFLRQQLRTSDLWQPLRRNFHSRDLFVHACVERVDGLRIQQFLKHNPAFHLSPSQLPVDFLHDSIDTINHYRDTLLTQEVHLRRPTANLHY